MESRPDEKAYNLPASGKPSRRAAAGTMLHGRQTVQKGAKGDIPVASQGLCPLTKLSAPDWGPVDKHLALTAHVDSAGLRDDPLCMWFCDEYLFVPLRRQRERKLIIMRPAYPCSK